MTRGSSLRKYLGLLRRKYGGEHQPDHRTALEELLFSILAEGVGEGPARKALERIEAEFVDFNELRASRPREVAELLSFLPHPAQKAERIKKVLEQIAAQNDEVGLDPLLTLKPAEAAQALLSIEGVGARQVADVLLTLHGEVPIVVDERVKRVLERLGLVEPGAPDKAVERFLQRFVPRDRLLAFYHLFSDHAESICTPTDYQCKVCVLKGECRFYKEKVGA